MSSGDALGGATDTESPYRGNHRTSKLLSAVSGVERELWFVAILAMTLDVTLTIHGLKLGLAEVNPVARSALASADIFGLYALKLVALLLGAGCALLVPRHYRGLIPLGLAIPSVLAVVNNAVVITIVSV